MQAAIDGSREIGFTIISMTISLVAVFIPVLFMGGIVGRLLREFAVVISRRDSGLRCRVVDADTDARQPLPEAHRAARCTGRFFSGRSGSSIDCFSGYERTPALGDARQARHSCWSRLSFWA